ncbi:hypothetical protein PAECIP111802_06913 [Paenibacillus allorhizosphaerae]|uniref:ABC-transporter extension domain-containing protein n=1 Tax=Paenibacillus allorhizosphaerae TaxID=2849866 RepID=A0ABM8VTZ7_9BACL|nr:hypothetical protein PAECIP111802_06913 [Paenibacillus allorhizosphaerae]
MLLIKAKDIYVEYLGRDVLDIDQLELYEYDRIGLVGANGAGKSTLLKARFLVNRFKHYSGALLVISHDRYFLDQIVDKIWELNDGRITEYWGGYTDYLVQKKEERQSQVTQYKQYVAERERLEQAIDEKKSQARKLDQKAKRADRKNRSESGGRLGHQQSQGSKQKSSITQPKYGTANRSAWRGYRARSHTKRSIPAEQSAGVAQSISDCGKGDPQTARRQGDFRQLVLPVPARGQDCDNRR